MSKKKSDKSVITVLPYSFAYVLKDPKGVKIIAMRDYPMGTCVVMDLSKLETFWAKWRGMNLYSERKIMDGVITELVLLGEGRIPFRVKIESKKLHEPLIIEAENFIDFLRKLRKLKKSLGENTFIYSVSYDTFALLLNAMIEIGKARRVKDEGEMMKDEQEEE